MNTSTFKSSFILIVLLFNVTISFSFDNKFKLCEESVLLMQCFHDKNFDLILSELLNCSNIEEGDLISNIQKVMGYSKISSYDLLYNSLY